MPGRARRRRSRSGRRTLIRTVAVALGRERVAEPPNRPKCVGDDEITPQTSRRGRRLRQRRFGDLAVVDALVRRVGEGARRPVARAPHPARVVADERARRTGTARGGAPARPRGRCTRRARGSTGCSTIEERRGHERRRPRSTGHGAGRSAARSASGGTRWAMCARHIAGSHTSSANTSTIQSTSPATTIVSARSPALPGLPAPPREAHDQERDRGERAARATTRRSRSQSVSRILRAAPVACSRGGRPGGTCTTGPTPG